MTKLMYKWYNSETKKFLEYVDYKRIHLYASQLGDNVDEHIKSHGYSKVLSYGKFQDPLNNSAVLMSWCKIEDGKLVMITKWHYMQLAQSAEGSMTKLIESIGLRKLKDMGAYLNKSSDLTRWINIDTGDILSRNEYVNLATNKNKGEMSMTEFLTDVLGYTDILQSKKKIIVKKLTGVDMDDKDYKDDAEEYDE